MVSGQTMEKVSITLPRELAEELRRVAGQGKVSSFVTGALRDYLFWLKQQEGLEKAWGTWSDAGHPELREPGDTLRYVNKIRAGSRKRLTRLARKLER